MDDDSIILYNKAVILFTSGRFDEAYLILKNGFF